MPGLCQQGLVRLLYQRSSGNPLFFTALVDELLQRGMLEEGHETVSVRGGMATVSGIVPESLHLLITQQVEQLSSEDQAVLEAASVAGMTFAVAAVAAAVDLALSTIETRCATWARQGWLVQDHGTETWPDGTVAACYGFRHALYQEVISARISPGQRIHLHYHIGNRKERAYADQTQGIAAELAVHFEQAREMQRAVSYRHKSAETALQRSAYTEAIAHLTQGLTLLTTLPDTPERAQHELALTLALGGPLAVTKGMPPQRWRRSTPGLGNSINTLAPPPSSHRWPGGSGSFIWYEANYRPRGSSARSACPWLATMPLLCW